MLLTSNDQAIFGGENVLNAVVDLINKARDEILINVFRLTSIPIIIALDRAKQRGVSVHLLADQKQSPPLLWGQNPPINIQTPEYKQHSKLIIIDKSKALIATDISDYKSAQRLVAAIVFEGPKVQAIYELERAIRNGDTASERAYSRQARSYQVYSNSPASVGKHLSISTLDFIYEAEEYLSILTKKLNDPLIVKYLLKTTQRGVRVSIFTHAIDPDQELALIMAGARVVVFCKEQAMGKNLRLQGTLASSRDADLISTQYLSTNVFGLGQSPRHAREIGLIVDKNTGLGEHILSASDEINDCLVVASDNKPA